MSKKEQDQAKVISIREKLLERAKISDTGVVEGDKDEIQKVFVETLPEGLTEDQVKAYNHHLKLFVAGAGGTSIRAAEILNKNADIEHVNYELPIYDGTKVQVMASRTDLNVALVTNVVNPKTAHLKSEFENFFAALDKSEE